MWNFKVQFYSNILSLVNNENWFKTILGGEKVKRLIEVILKVAENYMDRANIIIAKNYLTLEYFYYRNDERDLYKTIEIQEFEDKLKIIIFPEKVEKIINVNGIDDIILTLDKQSKAKKHTQEEIKYIKKKYVEGTKIELIKMYDLTNPIEEGTKGEVDFVDDIGTIHVSWETGSSLGLVVGTDEFKIIGEDE